MENRFTGQSVLITGGTSGIGMAAAGLFLAGGAAVAIVGRDAARGRQALAALHASSDMLIYIQGDVSTVDGCDRIVAQAAAGLGQLDIVVNSAGAYLEKAIEEVSPAEYQLLMDTHVRGTYFVAQFAVPHLKRRQHGAIINVSSDAGTNGNFLCTAYCAAKGAVNTFSKALALELAPYGIRVNCVCPGDVDTPLLSRQLSATADAAAAEREMASLYPMGRLATADEVARAICFLASDEASFITGALLPVDGGLTAC